MTIGQFSEYIQYMDGEVHKYECIVDNTLKKASICEAQHTLEKGKGLIIHINSA